MSGTFVSYDADAGTITVSHTDGPATDHRIDDTASAISRNGVQGKKASDLKKGDELSYSVDGANTVITLSALPKK